MVQNIPDLKPLQPVTAKKNSEIRVRCTTEELSQIKERAKRNNMCLSDYVRFVLTHFDFSIELKY